MESENSSDSFEENAKIKDNIIKLFEQFYDVKMCDSKPFFAEAIFRSHEEQFVFVRSARIAESESNEYVFFCETKHLCEETVRDFSMQAWNSGLSRVKPHFSHRNSDVLLVIISKTVDEKAQKICKKLHFSKSYCFSLKGWSDFRLCVLETSTSRVFFNRLGKDVSKSIQKSIQKMDL